MFIEILIDSAITATVYIILYQLIFPVATRKEFEEYKKFVYEKFEKRSYYLNEKITTFDSLAKELGYEYVSEAVKEDDLSFCPLTGNTLKVGEKAVLRYSWKKIGRKKEFSDEFKTAMKHSKDW